MAFIETILSSLLVLIIGTFIGALLVMLIAKLLKFKDSSYNSGVKAVGLALLCTFPIALIFTYFLPSLTIIVKVISIVLIGVFIKKFYKVSTKEAVRATLILAGIAIILALLPFLF